MAKLIELKNGMKLFYERNPGSKAFAMGVFVGAGCFYEPPEINGVSHFIEHILFKGTTTRSAFDIADEADKRGIALNAYTTRFYTAYYTVGMAEYASDCADLLSDLYYNAVIAEEDVEKEKNVVTEEINMYEDDGEDLCVERLKKAYFGNGPFSRPILGTKKTVLGLTKKDIVGFREKFYVPRNTAVAIVGNIGEREAAELASSYFGRKSEGEFLPLELPLPRPRTGCIRKIKGNEQSCVALAFPSVGRNDPKFCAPAIVSNILSGGMSSRLFQKIREEKGLVYEIYTTNDVFENYGFFTLYFATSPDRVEDALGYTRECLAEIRETGVTKEEFEKAAAQFKTLKTLEMESSPNIMRLGGRNALENRLVTYETLINLLSAVTFDEVNETLEYILDFNKAALSYVGQKPKVDLYRLFSEGK